VGPIESSEPIARYLFRSHDFREGTRKVHFSAFIPYPNEVSVMRTEGQPRITRRRGLT
jgi:hypothetical protein